MHGLGETEVAAWSPVISVSPAVKDQPELARFAEVVRSGYVAPAIVFSDHQGVTVAGRHFAVQTREGGLFLDSIHTLGRHHWHQLFFGIGRSRVYPLFERPPLIVGNSGSRTYYHWTMESVGAMLVRRLLDGPGGPVVAPPLNARWKQDLQELFAIDDPIVAVEQDELAVFDAAVLTNLTGRGASLSPHPVMLDQFVEQMGPLPTTCAVERIYLSRLNVPDRRRMENEEELCALLGAHGFSIVDPAILPVAEQAALFRQARLIVAPHGAALTNLAYVENGGAGPRVVELFQEGYLVRCYAKLAQAKRLDYRVIVNPCTSASEDHHATTWRCDLDLLERVLKSL